MSDNTDPAAKARLVAGAILLPVVWLTAATSVIGLLAVLPEHQVDDYAWLIVIVGLAAAVLGTAVVVNCVIQGEPLDID